MNVRVYGNTAMITGKTDVAGTMAGKDTKGQIMFTRVYVKKGGSWQSVAFQQTLVPTPQTKLRTESYDCSRSEFPMPKPFRFGFAESTRESPIHINPHRKQLRPK